jgi:hypothetical protein
LLLPFYKKPPVLKVRKTSAIWKLAPAAAATRAQTNGQETIWLFTRQNWFSDRVFQSFDDNVDHCCYAWNTLIEQPRKIVSVARAIASISEIIALRSHIAAKRRFKSALSDHGTITVTDMSAGGERLLLEFANVTWCKVRAI